MYIQQIYTNCLAHAAYYIESGHEAAVIDPLRDPAPYLKLARERGTQIKYVFETHFHADFVSGHIDLANKTGASIVFGPNATPAYKAYIAEDGEILHLGKEQIEVLHTPGHTIESICILVKDEHGVANAVFTGDTLFVGDVGRPDLLSGNLPKEVLGGMLFDSLQNKIKPLADSITVYPGHGAGSACGKNIGSQSYSTIGDERAKNYAMLITNKEDFIAAVTTDQPVIPGYFFKDAVINKTGAGNFDDVMTRNLQALSVDAFNKIRHEGALVLDTRSPAEFAKGFISGSVNIGLTGDFAVWVGTLIDADKDLLLITDLGREREAVERLARIGFEKVHGYLNGGIDAWTDLQGGYETIPTYTGAQCSLLLETEGFELLDVRNRLEVAKHRMAGSLHIPLNQLKNRLDAIDNSKKWLIYCAGGYRSMIAASYLMANGYDAVASVEGGIKEVISQAPELVEFDLMDVN